MPLERERLTLHSVYIETNSSEATMQTQIDPDYYDRLIGERDAADYLCYSVRALQNWRVRGGGPLFIKVSGRSVRYTRRDLQKWIAEKRVANTSLSLVE
ncbi:MULTISPECIES: helix-turn-helix transcriptional regulator [Halocynthiibacter]|uniref:Helix-turn-helix domain-containing protein n=1 Tax=Halocynthiibacter halioticoli TaxID=2986804 RepID=A0AAE3IYC9_9RHOB|nr:MULTISPECIES: helix-turn-helix domain-containing protein [Halocynthiibacter]MCV6823163.1 helix-turn-helix domain-containing protein [Halocynthiibacter halioticoli]MCW4056164.1 helix-turn-helix domain-containing protein [Halocynthiibacter sp. SDUM655004]